MKTRILQLATVTSQAVDAECLPEFVPRAGYVSADEFVKEVKARLKQRYIDHGLL